MEKLAGNQNVRNTITGEYAKETERNDPERVVETDPEKEDYSEFMKEWIRLGLEIEERSCFDIGSFVDSDEPKMDELTIAAMLHVQSLKRVDKG